MATIQSCKYAEWDREGGIGWQGEGTYPVYWDVVTEEDDLSPGEVIESVWALEAAGEIDPVQGIGVSYEFNGYQDPGSICLGVRAKLKDKATPTQWLIWAQFGMPPKGKTIEQILEPNPLNWPPSYGLRVIEEQVLVEEATCITDLSNINRGPNSVAVDPETGYPLAAPDPDDETNEPGPICNAVGQQTIDPQMRTARRPILIVKKNFSTLQEVINLNDAWQDKVNSKTFLGVPARSWLYHWTEIGDLVEVKVNGALIQYYPGVTAIELNKKTWDRFILNNGMSCFKRDVEFSTNPLIEDEEGNYVLHDCMVRASITDTTLVPCAEPVNLALEGTQLQSGKRATTTQWRFYEEANFWDMNDLWGTDPDPDGE